VGTWCRRSAKGPSGLNQANAEAIFDTHPAWPYEYLTYTKTVPTQVVGYNFYVTGKSAPNFSGTDLLYVFLVTYDDILPPTLLIPFVRPAVLSKPLKDVVLLGGLNGGRVDWHITEDGLNLEEANQQHAGLRHVFVWKLTF